MKINEIVETKKIVTFNIEGKSYDVDLTSHLKKKGLNNIVESIRKSLKLSSSLNKEEVHQTIRDQLLKWKK